MPGDAIRPPSAVVHDNRTKLEAFILRTEKRMPVYRIAQHLGVSEQTVTRWIREYVSSSIPHETVEDLRRMEVLNLEQLEARAIRLIEEAEKPVIDNVTGEPIGLRDEDVAIILKAQDQLVAISNRKSKLMGLDAPTKVLHGAAVRTDYDFELEKIVGELSGGGALLTGPEEVLELDG